MAAAENKQLLQQLFSELAKGNSRPFVECMADDISWTLTGSTKWSKTYSGKQSLLADLFAPLLARISGNLTTIAHRFIADGDHVVVEARGHNTTKPGVAYNNTYCFVFRLAGGKLVEVTEYQDTALVNAVLGDPAAA